MASSGHVGPIIFSVPEARHQLEEHGEVYTFRSSERTTGETWWRESRTGPKRGDVLVEQIEAVDPSNPFDLTPYEHKSGFDGVPEWMGTIERLHGGFPPHGFIYRTTLRLGDEPGGPDV